MWITRCCISRYMIDSSLGVPTTKAFPRNKETIHIKSESQIFNKIYLINAVMRSYHRLLSENACTDDLTLEHITYFVNIKLTRFSRILEL